MKSFITGHKRNLSAYSKNLFKKAQLSHLLSPSGLHFAPLFFFLQFLIAKLSNQWLKRLTTLSMLVIFYFLFPFYSLKRLMIFRCLYRLNFYFKLKRNVIEIFYATFLFSFFLGHYTHSPLGFIYSFAFFGAFCTLSDYSRFKLILGIFTLQLLFALFSTESVSLLAVAFAMILTLLFSVLLICIMAFYLSFWIIPFNWCEILIQGFVVLVKCSLKISQLTSVETSLSLMISVIVIMNYRAHRSMPILLIISLITGASIAHSPSVILDFR